MRILFSGFAKNCLHLIFLFFCSLLSMTTGHAGQGNCRSPFTLSSADLDAFRTHRVHSIPILPAAAFLAFAFNELAKKDTFPLTLSKVDFSAAYRLDANKVFELNALREGDKLSLPSSGKKPYLKAKIVSQKDVEMTWDEPKPHEGWVDELSDSRVGKDSLQGYFHTYLNLSYGIPFQRLSHIEIHPSSKSVRGTLAINQSLWSNWVFDPGVLDSALQLSAALIRLQNDTDEYADPAVPIRLGNVTLVRELERDVRNLRAIVQVSESSPSFIRFRLKISDDSGVLLQIQDGLLARLKKEQMFTDE